MARPRGATDQVPTSKQSRMIAAAAAAPLPPPSTLVAVEARAAKLRELLYEAEKSCQWLSSAVNTPDLPAGAWIYVDALRLVVLAAMRNAQLLQLKVRELLPDPPAAPKG